MRLYSYFRSSASWRVRIALHLKGLPFETVPVHLLKDGGEQHAPSFKALNPLETVPLLEIPGDPPLRLGESLAIIQYLDETHPNPPLLPGDAAQRARIRWLAEVVNAGIHPVQNLGVLQHVEKTFGATAEQRKAWAAHFIGKGFTALETLLVQSAGTCCVGNQVTLADLCLFPQVYNAKRFGVDVAAFPTIQRVAAHLGTIPAFVQADPFHQPDTPAEERVR